MVDIPEHLLQRSAEARAKALGISIEQAIAEMKGQSDPTVISKEPEVKIIDETPAPAAETPAKPADAPPPPAKTITPLKEEHSTETTEKVAEVNKNYFQKAVDNGYGENFISELINKK